MEMYEHLLPFALATGLIFTGMLVCWPFAKEIQNILDEHEHEKRNE